MKSLQISDPAAAALASVQSRLLELDSVKFTTSPSSSVTIEFLQWWFENTIKGSGIDLGEFSPATRVGRPVKPALVSECRPIAPSTIRKLAGVDPITPPRML